MPKLEINTDQHSTFKDITGEIRRVIPMGFNGICHIFCCHTTAALTINENADPDVVRDVTGFLNRMVPWNDGAFTHFEGNSAAHIKSSLLGVSLSVPVVNGELLLGCWQSIYFCEFDGPRRRTVAVTLIAGGT